MNAYASKGCLGLAMLVLAASAQAATPEPARDFCRSRGGNVLETGEPEVHICCYPARRRCVAVNARSQLSSPVAFPDAVSDATPANDGRELSD
jgi:hypothetical protein